MGPRTRKAIGMAGLVTYLGAYIVVAVTLAARLPDHPAVELGYFLVAGMAWVPPLKPLMSWMNRPA